MSRFLADRSAALSPYIPGEQPQDKSYIKLNTNESPFPPSKEVIKTVNSAECENLRLYSDPDLKALRKTISEYYSVSPDEVFCANGSDEVLSFAFCAWGSDCGAAFPDITYGFYPVFSQFYGIAEDIIPLTEDFKINPADYYNKNKLIVIANPNAPTGILMPIAEIRKIAESNRENVVIVDEAYIDFGGESALPLISELDNVLVVRTFSKSRQLAGARLGFALGNRELIADLNRLKFSFNPYNVNRLTSAAGIAAIEDGEYFDECRNKIISNRKYTADALKKLGFEVLDSSANFIFAKTMKISGEELYLRLKKEGILVRHFCLDRIKDYVRITIGTMEQMQIFIEKVSEILKENEL